MKKGLFGLNGFASVVVFIVALMLIAAIVVFSTVGSVITVDPVQAPAEAAVSDYQHGSNINRSEQTSGTAVSKAADLRSNLGNNANSSSVFHLTRDITLSASESFMTSGTFSGTLYGNGYTITVTGSQTYTGLATGFAHDTYIGGLVSRLTGKIYDLNVVLATNTSASFRSSGDGTLRVGLIAGVLDLGGVIENCTVTINSGSRLAAHKESSGDNWASAGAVAGGTNGSMTIRNVTVTNNGDIASGLSSGSLSENFNYDSRASASMFVSFIWNDRSSYTQIINNVVAKGSGSIRGYVCSILGMLFSSVEAITVGNYYNLFSGDYNYSDSGTSFVSYTLFKWESADNSTVTNYYNGPNTNENMMATHYYAVPSNSIYVDTAKYNIFFDSSKEDLSKSLGITYSASTPPADSERTYKLTAANESSWTTKDIVDGKVIFTGLPTEAATWSSNNNFYATLTYTDTKLPTLDALTEYEHGYVSGNSPSGTAISTGDDFFNKFIDRNSGTPSGNYYLTDDIFITGFTGKGFSGTLDGNGKTIYIVGAQAGTNGSNIGGLVGTLTGTIKNVRVVIYSDVNVDAGSKSEAEDDVVAVGIGGIAGKITGNGSVENVSVVIKQGVTFKNSWSGSGSDRAIGGIAGEMIGSGSVKNCTVQLDGYMLSESSWPFAAGIVGITEDLSANGSVTYENIILKGSGQLGGYAHNDTNQPTFAAAITTTQPQPGSPYYFTVDGFIYNMTNEKPTTGALDNETQLTAGKVSSFGYVCQNDNDERGTSEELSPDGIISYSNIFDYNCSMSDHLEYHDVGDGNVYYNISRDASILTAVDGLSGSRVTPYFRPGSDENITLVASAGDWNSYKLIKAKGASTAVSVNKDNTKVVDVPKNEAYYDGSITLEKVKTVSEPVVGSLAYTGEELSYTVTIQYDGQTLGSNDFTATVAGDGSVINAGEYTLEVTLSNGYYFYDDGSQTAKLSDTFTFTVNKASVTLIVGLGDSVTEYDGQGKTGGDRSVSISGNPAISQNELGSLTYTYNGLTNIPVNAGEYTVGVIIGNSANIDAAVTVATLTVTPKQVTLTHSETELSFTDITDTNKDSAAIYGEVGIADFVQGETEPGFTVSLNTDEATWIQDNERTEYLAAGKYKLTVTLSGGNYKLADGADTVWVTVTENEYANRFVTGFAREGWKYYSKPNPPKAAVARFGEPVVTYYYDQDRSDPVVGEFTNLTPAGTYYYTVTVAGTNSYNALSANGSFEVAKLEVKIALSAAEAVYTGTAYPVDSVTVTLTGADGMTDYSDDRDTLLGTVAWKIDDELAPVDSFPKNEGSYTLGIYSINNAANIIVTDGLDSVTATILIKPYTVSFIAELKADKSITYGDEISDFKDFATVTADIEGFEDWTYTAEAEDYTSSTNAGIQVTVTVTVSINNNNYALSDGSYTAVFELKTTVQKADIELDISIDGGAYTGESKKAQVTGQPKGVEPKTEYYSVENDTYILLDDAPKDAGSYAVRVTVSGAANYNDYDSDYISYTILKAAVSFTVSIDDWTYGDAHATPSITGLKPDVEDIRSAIQFTYNGNTYGGLTYESGEIPSEAGKYTVTAYYPVSDNYEDYTAYDNFEIAKADPVLTLTVNESLTYNAEDQAVTYTLSGHNENGTVTSFVITDADGVTVENGKIRNAGVYKATATVGNTANYNQAEVRADFTVAASVLTIGDDYANGKEVAFGILNKENHSSQTNYLNIVEGIYLADTGEGHSVYKLALDVSDSDFAEDYLIVKQEGYILTVTVTDGNYTFADGSSPTVKVEVTKAANEFTGAYSRDSWDYYDVPSAEVLPVPKFGKEMDVKTAYYTDSGYSEPYKGNLDYSTPAGTYYVLAFVEGTENYNYTEQKSSFTVNKREVSINISCSKTKFVYGDSFENVFKVEYDNFVDVYIFGECGWQYRLKGASDWTAGLPEKPDVGEYEINYYYTNTANVELSDTSDTDAEFTVIPAEVEFTVSIPDGNDLVYGMGADEVEKLVSIQTDTELYYEVSYTVALTDGGKYSSLTNAGTSVTVTVEITVDNANYKPSVKGALSYVLTVQKAVLTVKAEDLSILRRDISRYYEIESLYGCYKGEGLKNGHSISDLFSLSSDPEYGGDFVYDEYTVTASIREDSPFSANYSCSENSDFTVLFTLSVASYEMSFSIDGWTYGDEETHGPTGIEGVPQSLGKNIIWTYCIDNEEQEELASVPVEAGNYILKAYIPATAEYTAGKAECKFTIAPKEITVSAGTVQSAVYHPDAAVYADEFYDYFTVVGAVSGETDTILALKAYKDGNIVPNLNNAGSYEIRAEIVNKNYVMASGAELPVLDFTVEKADMNVSVSVEGWTYGSAPAKPVIEGIAENAGYSLNYSGLDNSSQPYSSADAPKNAGVYTLTVTVEGTENYNGTEVTSDSFTVSRQSITSRVSIIGWVYGQYDANKNAPFVTPNPGKGDVKYTYAVYGTDEFVSAVPENAGSYTVKAVIAETANYTEAYATLDFEIEKASIAPGIASVTGREYSGNAALVNLINGSNPGSAAVMYSFEKYSGGKWNEVSEAVYAGSYRVKAEVAASDNYFGGITEYFEFAVSAKEIIYTWSLTDDKIVYGDSLDMVLGSVVYDETGILASFVERDRGYVTFTASALVDGALYTPAVNAGSSVIFSLAVALDAEKAGADVSDSYIITLSAPAVDSKEVAVKQIAIDAASFSDVYGNSYTEDISLGEYFGGYFTFNGESVNALEDGVNTVEYAISSDSALLPNAGSYIVTVSVSGNYSGEAELTYVIKKAVIALNSGYEFAFGYLNAANIADKGVYGSLILGLIGGESVDYALMAATDADDLYADYLKVNSYTVTVTLPDDVNYIFADGIYASFVVNVVKGENEWVSEFVRDDWTYLSEPSEAVMPVARFDAEYVSVKYYSDPEYTNELGEDGFAPGIPAGVYYAVATVGGTENYGALRGEYTFEVLKLNAIVSVSTPDAEFDGEPYDGIGYSVSGADASVMGEVSWKYSADGGATFTNGLPTDAGHYIIRIDGIANESVTVYNGYENFYLTVNPKQIEFKVRLNDFTVYYGDEIDPTELIAEPVPASDECGSFSYSVKAVNGIGVEYYAGMLAKSKIFLNVSIDIDDSNYVAVISSGDVSFEIQPKEIKPEIVVEEAVVADGEEISIANGYEYTVIDAIKNYMAESGVKHYDYDIFVNGARYSASETTWEPGEYTVSVSLSGNHSGSMEIKMTVEENADYATVSVREPLTPVGEFLNTINLNMAGALAILFAFIVSVVVILFFGLRRKNK